MFFFSHFRPFFQTLMNFLPDLDPLDEKDVISNDPILISITELVAFVRSKKSEHLELEIRVGTFGQDNTFHPGYSHIGLIRRMITRLKNNCAKLKSWTTLNEVAFLNTEFPNNVRKRVGLTPIPIIVKKEKLSKIDIGSDRMMLGLRVSLSRETPVLGSSLVDNEGKELAPSSIRYIHRASFIQKIHFTNTFSVSVQFDISKVSQSAPNKLECTKTPAQYHCEVELLDKLTSLNNPEEEIIQNQYIAYALLQAAKTFLGTHKIIVGEVPERLTQPNLVILSKSMKH